MKKLFFLLLLLPAALIAGDIRSLMPKPKGSFERGSSFTILPSTLFVMAGHDSITQKTYRFLRDRIERETGMLLSSIPASGYSGQADVIIIGSDSSFTHVNNELRRAMPRGETFPGPQGYILDVDSRRIIVAGQDEEGLFNAATSLVQLSGVAGNPAAIHGCHIMDYPDYPLRWNFVLDNLRRNANAVSYFKNMADSMVKYKLNGIQINDYKFNILYEQPDIYFRNADTLKKYWTDNNLEIIPGIAGFGWSEGLLYYRPNLAEGIEAKATYVFKGDTGELKSDPRVSLPNGGFETLANGQFGGWSFIDGPGQYSFADSAVFHSGSKSIRFENFTSGQAVRAIRTVDCDPHKYYIMTGWIKTENFSGSDIRLHAIGSNGDTSRSLTYTQFDIPATTNGWIRVQVSFNTLEFRRLSLYAGVWNGKSGKLWWDDVEIREAGLLNVLRRNGTPLHVRDASTGRKYAEGFDFYPVMDSVMLKGHGSYRLDHEAPKLRRMPLGSMTGADSVSVSFFHPFTAVSDNVGNGSTMICVSEDDTYGYVEAQTDRLKEVFAPESFFLGHDEIRNMNRDSACLHRHLSPAELLADNIKRCTKIVNKVSPGARKYIWSDMLDSLHNAVNNYYLVNGDLRGVWNMIEDKPVIVNWNNQRKKASAEKFSEQGYSQISAPYYDAGNASTIRQWRLAQQGIEGMKGSMYTTWNRDYRFLREFGYYFWGAGPNIIHTPLSLNMFGRDSIEFLAEIEADPFDSGDSIVTAEVELDIPFKKSMPRVQLVRKSASVFSASTAVPVPDTTYFRYRIIAVNSQGLERVTPFYVVDHKQDTITGTGDSDAYLFDASVFPNPLRENSLLKFTCSGTWSVRISDILGRDIYSRSGTAVLPEEISLNFGAEKLSPGVYLFEIISGNKRSVLRLIR